MKVTCTTGDPYDHITLVAETVAECAALVSVGMNQFVRDKDRVMLIVGGFNNDTVSLRVRVSAIQNEHDPKINVEHDREN